MKCLRTTFFSASYNYVPIEKADRLESKKSMIEMTKLVNGVSLVNKTFTKVILLYETC